MGRDRGRGIGEQVKIVIDLIENTEKLKEVRKASEKTRKKLMTGSASSAGGFGNSFGNDNSSWNAGSVGGSKPRSWDDDDDEDSDAKSKKKKKKKEEKEGD